MKTFNKLVRDKIPEIIHSKGEKANTRILSQEEYLAELRKKLVEEANEYMESGSMEELADVMEVIVSIMRTEPSMAEQVEIMRISKAVERGSFDKRIFLISTESDNDKTQNT